MAEAPEIKLDPTMSEKCKSISFNVNSKNKADPTVLSGIKSPKDINFEELLAWQPPKSLQKNYYFEVCEKTLDGCPGIVYRYYKILTIQMGQWDFRRISSAGQHHEDWVKYIDFMFAKLDKQMKKNGTILGQPVSKFVAVIDYEHFGMKQIFSLAGMSKTRQFVQRYESKYPGTITAVYIVNASAAFKILLSMMKPLMSSGTVESFQIYGSNQNEWKAALLQNIPSNQLPFRLGGTLVPAGTQVVDYKHLIYGRRYSIFADASMDHDED